MWVEGVSRAALDRTPASLYPLRPSVRTPLSALLAMAMLTAACNESGTTPDDCAVSAVALTGAPANLDIDETVQLTANITSEGCSPAPTATWTSSSNAIATVRRVA